MRKFIYLSLSLFLVFSSVTSAFASSAWAVTKAVSVGKRVIVNATSGGYKAAVNLSPSAARLALKLVKGANTASLVYAAAQIGLDGVDYVLDPENNSVKFKDKNWISEYPNLVYAISGGTHYPSAEIACQKSASSGSVFVRVEGVTGVVGSSWKCVTYSARLDREFESTGKIHQQGMTPADPETQFKSLPLGNVAAQVLENAKNGHAASQEAVKETALEMVATGDFDSDLLTGAIPLADTRPVVPAVPISGNGNVSPGDMQGGDVGKAADDARAAADSARKVAQAAKDALTNAIEDARKAADEAESVKNSAVDQAIKDAAKSAADVAAQTAKDAKDVAKEAAKKAAEAADKAARSADKAKEVADKALEDAKKVADEALEDVKDKALEDVKEAEKEAVKAKERAEAAEKALEKAKAEAAVPFELPAFCAWASTVCDFIDWVKRDPVIDDSDGTLEIDETSDSMHEGILERLYISMPAQCPPDPVLEFMGSRIPFPMSVFCQFASMMKPLILLFAYIKGLSVIGSGLS